MKKKSSSSRKRPKNKLHCKRLARKKKLIKNHNK